MSVLARWGRELWDFVVGDDWRTALVSAAAIGVVAGLAAVHVAAWWVLPLTVPVVLAVSTRRG